MAEPVLAKIVGSVTNLPQGGVPLVTVDADFESLQSNTKLAIKLIAAAYTVVKDDSGKVLVMTSASAVTITLPAASGNDGMHLWIVGQGAGALTIAATAGELVAFNDAAANSIAFSTTSEIIGGAVHCICTGSKWLALVHLAAETQTPTIAT